MTLPQSSDFVSHQQHAKLTKISGMLFADRREHETGKSEPGLAEYYPKVP